MWSGDMLRGWMMRYGCGWQGAINGDSVTLEQELTAVCSPSWDDCVVFNHSGDLRQSASNSTLPTLLSTLGYFRAAAAHTGCVFQVYGVNLVEQLAAVAIWQSNYQRK